MSRERADAAAQSGPSEDAPRKQSTGQNPAIPRSIEPKTPQDNRVYPYEIESLGRETLARAKEQQKEAESWGRVWTTLSVFLYALGLLFAVSGRIFANEEMSANE
jgi:hypothetical protein